MRVPRWIVFLLLIAPAQVANGQGVGDIESAILDKQRRADQASRPISDTKSQIGCSNTSSSDEIVICGPAPRKYGPDRDAMKAAEPPAAPPAGDPRETANAPQCGTGGNLCDSGQIPVSAIALAGAKAAIAAIKGEDWKAVFRTRPDEYQRYLQARKKRRAGARDSAAPEAQTYR